MNNPKVTVVMPVYNAQKYMRESLDAIVNQTYANLEIICVDDGSTDDSPAILSAYCEKDPRVKVIQQKNQFAGIARNNGLAHATGDYIMFIDSDDILERKAISYLVKKAMQYDTDVIVYGYYMFLDDVRRRRPVRNKYKNGLLCSSREISEKVFQITRSMPWDKFIKTEFLRKTGLQYQPMRVSEDIYVNRTMMTEADRIYFTGKRFLNYRIGNQDSLQGKINRYPAEFLKGNLAIAEELQRIGTYEIYKSSFEKIITADAIMHLHTIDAYEHFAAIVETAQNIGFWDKVQVHETSEAVQKSDYRQTLEKMMEGNTNECLAKFYAESRANSIPRSSIEYRIGHGILKLLHLTYQ